MITDAEHTAVTVLAAGKGTRMRSDKAKVLHELDGRPMIHYVIRTARALVGENVVVIVGHQADRVREVVTASHGVSFALQDRQLGTGQPGEIGQRGQPRIDIELDEVGHEQVEPTIAVVVQHG